MKIKYDAELMAVMALFEKITRAKLKDCFFDEISSRMVFVVEEHQLMTALGKNASNVKSLEKSLNKKIKIVQYSPNILELVRSWIQPLKADRIEQEEDVITITGSDTQTKGLLIGKNAANLRHSEEVIRRYFPNLKEIKVI